MAGGSGQGRDRWMRILTVTWSLVGIGLLLYAAGWVFGKISGALVPFVFALILVFVFRGPVAEFERRGVPRGLAVGLCYIIGLLIFGTIIGFLVPLLIQQVRDFVVAFPDYYDRANDLLLNFEIRYRSLLMPSWLEAALVNLQETVTLQSAEWSAALAKEVFSAGGTAVAVLGNFVLSLVAGFWILKDLPAIRREAAMLAGPTRRDEASLLMLKVSRILSGYLKGQLILSLVTGVIVMIGLTVIGVPYSLVIGVLAALLNVIPWIGPAITAVIAGIAAAFVSPLHILLAVGVCIGAQQATEYFIQPRVMSEQVDLHPLLVIFSLLVGATLFGFVGVVLAIPVAAVIKGLFVYYFEKYTDSKLTSEDGALFKTTVDENEAEFEPADAKGVDTCAKVTEDGDVEVTSETNGTKTKVTVEADKNERSKES